MLRLPTYEELSKEQDAINDLPVQGNYLIIGPPGTGKTVMAVYRARMFARARRRTQFLVYGYPLTRFLSLAISATGLHGTASTFHSWFWEWFRRVYHQSPPTLPENRWSVDWNSAYRFLEAGVPPDARYQHLVIDEGQDFPKEFYAVMKLIADHITVFADENQRITDQNSTIRDIQQYLLPRSVHSLTRNYRNTLPIAEFARQFYAGLPSGTPDLPTRRGPTPQLITGAAVAQQADFIARYDRNNPDRDTAVFVNTKEQIRSFARLIGEKSGHSPQIYISGDPQAKTIRFDQRGVKIVSYQSAKGLEFDTVFLPCVEEIDRTRDAWALDFGV